MFLIECFCSRNLADPEIRETYDGFIRRLGFTDIDAARAILDKIKLSRDALPRDRVRYLQHLCEDAPDDENVCKAVGSELADLAEEYWAEVSPELKIAIGECPAFKRAWMNRVWLPEVPPYGRGGGGASDREPRTPKQPSDDPGIALKPAID
jgi:hypothetical protein